MILGGNRILSAGGRILNAISTPPVSSPVLLQTVNIDMDTVPNTIPNWNVWVQGDMHGALLNTAGAVTTMSLQDVSGTFYSDEDAQAYPNPTNPDFPDAVLKNGIYLEANSPKVFRLDGCVVGRKYSFKFGSWGPTDEVYTDSKSRFTLNGVVMEANAIHGQVFYEINFTNIAPNASGQILITVAGQTPTDYAGMAGFIIKEYSN